MTSDSTQALWRAIQPLLALSDRKRPLGYLLATACAVGIPLLIGAASNRFVDGIVGSLGGLVMLYMPQTAIPHRLATLILCSFGFAASYALGLVSGFSTLLSFATLTLNVFLVIVACRYFAVPPPGAFFFIVIACVSRVRPFDLAQVAPQVGIITLAGMAACLLALTYGVAQTLFGKHRLTTPPGQRDDNLPAILIEAAVITLFVAGSYLFALLAGLDNPYWVPISCAAILQGATFRAVWHRHVHRVVGTVIGMGLAWILLSIKPGVWAVSAMIIGLTFIVEILVTRNYGLAVIFITPLTLLLAEAGFVTLPLEQLILSRLFDIVLGSSIGWVGGWVIHHPRLAGRLENRLRRLLQ